MTSLCREEQYFRKLFRYCFSIPCDELDTFNWISVFHIDIEDERVGKLNLRAYSGVTHIHISLDETSKSRDNWFLFLYLFTTNMRDYKVIICSHRGDEIRHDNSTQPTKELL